MRGRILLLFLLLPFLSTWAQNPATIFSIPNQNVVLACGVTCTSISATVPHIKETNDYLVTTMPYLPFDYISATGTEVTEVYQDDTWSEKIPMGFGFCFYGITYPTLLMGSNSNITFDTVRAGDGSGYVITTSTPIPNASSLNVYAPASIFGPYHDINPSDFNNPPPTDKRIEWRVEGVAPARRFIASYNDIAYFGSTCNTFKATHQMVLYESTGIIEVYIQDKPSCPDWIDGLAILGVMDETRTKAVAAPGKNATAWGSTGMNEAYRFTPNGGVPTFKKAELIVDGNVVALGDTASGVPGSLDLNFPNVCPTQDSTAYIIRVTYGRCNDNSQDVSYQDTVFIKRTTPILSLTALDADCATGGTITAEVTGTTGTFTYSLNGGTPQSNNVFSGLGEGNYTVQVQSAGCVAIAQADIVLQNSLSVDIQPKDTVICVGGSFIPVVSSNASEFSWTPTIGVSSATEMEPTLTVNENTQYIVTASSGNCIATDTVDVTVFTSGVADAGPDMTVIAGDAVQLQASGSAGTYVWTPPTGLSATNILQPMASPTATTVYTLEITTAEGCKVTDEVLVTVVPYCVQPMEAFTPNGDGMNDQWLVTTGNCLRSARVEVFNRYGAKVFESANYQNNWNGTYKGDPLPDGTYYYIITYQLINDKKVFLKGNVTILR